MLLWEGEEVWAEVWSKKAPWGQVSFAPQLPFFWTLSVFSLQPFYFILSLHWSQTAASSLLSTNHSNSSLLISLSIFYVSFSLLFSSFPCFLSLTFPFTPQFYLSFHISQSSTLCACSSDPKAWRGTSLLVSRFFLSLFLVAQNLIYAYFGCVSQKLKSTF